MKFPKLTDNQVAVLKAEGTTGIILTVAGNRYNRYSNDEVYLIFEDLIAATKYIEEFQQINDEIEFTVYDSDEKMIEYTPAGKWRNS